ncbi:MAG: ATP-binding protein [Planctomycetaceae bacterium]|nr:ATP-binding protein [Planctomycetaceae bacterium]
MSLSTGTKVLFVINYRSLKKLLGETSLERKCRLLLGGSLMILITISFWLYAARTRQIVENQQIVKAEALIPGILRLHHQKLFVHQITQSPTTGTAPETDPDDPRSAERILWDDFFQGVSQVDEFKVGAKWSVFRKDETPGGDEEIATLTRFRDEALKPEGTGELSSHMFVENDAGERHVRFYRALIATDNCLKCHAEDTAMAFQENEFVGMVSVELPMAEVEGKLSQNRAILVASAIVTSFLAMLVAYVIVRYIIVKPVLHLKDVSDEIARGNLNLRADISTGDEFEELSHAFNRMLRHMTTVNDELRGLNDNLDAKVDQLAQANMELFNTNAMKDEFLATMSHELRTPLNSILGFSDVLAGASNLDERQQRYVSNIRKSGRNLMVQINDLLDLAKIESGEMKIEVADVNVRDLLELQVSQIAPLADQKNIDVRVQHPEQPLSGVLQDAGKIRQIVTNLLSNAIKFTPEGGRVRVSSQMLPQDMFEICVEDTGIGIPIHEQQEIFQKFRQGTTTAGERDHMTREYGGTGLGLSIVRELSRLLGGDVSLESEFGKGSVFSIRLPLEAPPEKEQIDLSIESPSGTTLNRITSVDLLNRPRTVASDSVSDSTAEASEVSGDNADESLPGTPEGADQLPAENASSE